MWWTISIVGLLVLSSIVWAFSTVESARGPLKVWTALWMGLAIVWGFTRVGPAGGFVMDGHAAKIVFFHVPCAWIATIALVTAAVYAVSSVRNLSSLEADFKCAAAMELGFLFALLATITGSIFSRLQWNAYWVWNEPRMISILIVLLIFAAYLVLRGSVEDPYRRARLSSVYTLISLVPGVFLIWVLPRLIESLHPNQSFAMGQISIGFRIVMYGMAMPAFIGLFIWMLQLRVRLMKLLWRRELRSQAVI